MKEQLISKNMNQFKKIGKEIEKSNINREERCIPIAHFMLEQFIKSGVSLKTSDFQEVMKEYTPIYEAVIKEGLEKNWLINDIIYSVNYFIRLTENMKNLIELSLGENQEKAVNKAIGKDVKKLTVNDVDEMLKKA